jgi:hypothetical protein
VSNQAGLFGEDTPTPLDPFSEEDDSQTNTLWVAGAAYQIPAYWLFCFDKSDLTEIESEEGRIPGLVCRTTAARPHLRTRDGLARELFPEHVPIWRQWRRAIKAVRRKYLKVDAYEIWMLGADERELGRQLRKALGWFTTDRKANRDALLLLAGIEGYDRKTKTFPVPEGECPERYLYGWFESEDD